MTLAVETAAPERMQRRELSERAFAWALIAPALLFIAVIVVWPLAETIRLSFTDATQARMVAGSASSHASGMVLPSTLAQASFAFSTVRAVPMTRAPRSARTRIVSSPRPELQPVTRMV